MPAKMKTERAPTRRARAATPAAAPPAEDPLDALTLALERAFGMTADDAASVAVTVAERFVGADEVNDETIDAEVRSLFYTLEGRRILSFRREEYENAEGQKRRAFWWRIRREVVAELSAPPAGGDDTDIYAMLPAECWRRPAAAAES